jgi:hypothetical protein
MVSSQSTGRGGRSISYSPDVLDLGFVTIIGSIWVPYLLFYLFYFYELVGHWVPIDGSVGSISYTLPQKSHLCISRKGIVRPQSQIDFHIYVSVSDLFIPRIGLPILLEENMWSDPGNI